MTRDRTYQDGYWADREFKVVDTGGLVFDDDSEFLPEIREQAALALEEASVALVIVDGCLLYTSPSPRDLSTSRMPSSA